MNFESLQKMDLVECYKGKGRFLHIYSVSRKIERILNTTEAAEVKFDLCNVNSLFLGTSLGSCSLRCTNVSELELVSGIRTRHYRS